MKTMSVVKAALVLVPCAILNSIGMDIFAPAIPSMMKTLHTTEHKIQYIAVMFTLAVGIGQPLIGLACDKYGRRNTMLASCLLFVITSFATAYSRNIETLALLRFLEGLGACGALVVTFAVVNDLFDEVTSFKIFSLIGGILALAPMLAPILGVGLMTTFDGWQACFLFLGFFSLGSAIACYFTLPETRPDHTIIPSVDNLINNYKTILSNRRFVVYTMLGTLAMTELYLYFSIGSVLYIHKLHCTPLQFSLYFAFNAVIALIGNLVSTHLQKFRSAYWITRLGTGFILMGGVLMFAFATLYPLSITCIIFTNTIMTLGVGLMLGPATGAALQPFKELAGAASGLFGMTQYGTPALIGYLVTRAPIHTSISIAIPMILFSLLSLWCATWYRHQVSSPLTVSVS